MTFKPISNRKDNLVTNDTFGLVGLSTLDAPTSGRYVIDLKCERLYFAADRGICLTAEPSALSMKHHARVFDATGQVLHSVALTGNPSRARVSPDGRWAAITVFEQGHSYAEKGSRRERPSSTRMGKTVADLEGFAVWRDGSRFQAVDFNFWGVTFARDSNRLFATVATGGTPYLVEGDVRARSVKLIRAGVECLSLSPDNSRIAYKRLIEPAGLWRLHLLDLATLADRPVLSETRSIDDQIDGLDDAHVLYHRPSSIGADIWILGVDGTDPPRVLVPQAYSPSVVR